MAEFYLATRHKLIILFVLILLFLISNVFITTFGLLGISVVLFLYRVRPLSFNFNQDWSSFFFAPVDGVITKIDNHEVWIKPNFWGPFQIHAPMNSKVIEVSEEVEGVGKLKVFKASFKSLLENGTEYVISLESRFVFSKPKIFLESGDIAAQRALIAFIPFMARVKISLPSKASILIHEDSRVKVGETKFINFKE